jgi:NADH-quinone oxidoreductase subunit L
VKLSPLVLTILGALIAFWIYVLKEGVAKLWADQKSPVWAFLYNKWYFDELYDAVFVKGTKALGDLFWKIGDVKIIDGLGPNGAAWSSLKSAGWLSKFQSGYVYYYAFVMLVGVAGFLAFALYAFGG